MPRRTIADDCNDFITKENLTLDYVITDEVTLASDNCIGHLGDGTGSTVARDNSPREKALVFLAKIAIDRFELRFDLDHRLSRANGGNNHYTNLYPLPWRINRAKGLGFDFSDGIETIVKEATPNLRAIFGIPDGFEYLNVKDWLLKNYKYTK
jgi:hypothetical protein